MNLHQIPRERDARPLIPEDWEKAAGGFQTEYDNHHPIVFTVRNGVVVDMGFRNGNYNHRLHLGGLNSPTLIRNWSSRRLNTLDWNLVEIIQEGEINEPTW